MNITTRHSKSTGKPYIAVNFDNMTAEAFCSTLLEALSRKERRYAQAVAKMQKTDKYYLLAVHVLKRTQKQIEEIESAYYEYNCKMNDRLEKGNML